MDWLNVKGKYSVIVFIVIVLTFNVHFASASRLKELFNKHLRVQKGENADPWLDKGQSYPALKPSDAEEAKPEIATPDVQQYHDPLSPPTWLVHKDLEPPGLPQTPPPPPPEMPPALYESV